MTQEELFGRSARDHATAPTREVLRAVHSALRGDCGGAQARLAEASAGLKRRARRAVRSADATDTCGPADSLPGLVPIPELVPLRQVPLRLPDGRQVRLVLAPAVARYRDLVAVARVGDTNAGRAFAALAEQRCAIDALAAAQRGLARQLACLQGSEDLALLRGLVEGLIRLERRIGMVERRQDRALDVQRRALRLQARRQARAVGAERRAAQVRNLRAAVASVQTAAFGVQGELLAKDNLKLALNQIAWGFVSELLTNLEAATPGTVEPLVWLAPFGSLLTSQVLLGKGQVATGGASSGGQSATGSPLSYPLRR